VSASSLSEHQLIACLSCTAGMSKLAAMQQVPPLGQVKEQRVLLACLPEQWEDQAGRLQHGRLISTAAADAAARPGLAWPDLLMQPGPAAAAAAVFVWLQGQQHCESACGRLDHVTGVWLDHGEGRGPWWDLSTAPACLPACLPACMRHCCSRLQLEMLTIR